MKFQPVPGAGGREGGRAGAVAYVLCVTIVLLTTSLTLLASDGEQTTIASVPLPADAVCVRARREADYAVALLPLGRPTRETEVLFRPDRVVDAEPLWILGTANEQSELLNCSGLACSDVALLQARGHAALRFAQIDYVYHSAREDTSFAGNWLGLKGEVSMLRGWSYWLSTTRFCWAPTTELGDGTRVRTGSGYLVGNATDFDVDCDGNVQVFPVIAGHENYWLALTGNYLREHSETSLEERRRHAEAGTACGPMDTPWSRDCAAAGSCQELPSLPYRRALASQNVVIQTLGDEATVAFEKTPSLERVPGLLNASDAVTLGVLRLLLMALASAVAYVRRSQESSDSLTMLRRARRRVLDYERPVLRYTMSSVYVDAAIGVLAVAARLTVVLAMSSTLWEDGLEAVVVSEFIGCGISLLHFLLRNVVLDLDVKAELPLTKLGGSMALLDSAVAILVSFADPPAFGSHHAFSGLGRLLATLLIAISGIPLGVFAATACGMLAGGLRYDAGFFYLRGHVRLLWLSVGLWIAQLTTVSVAVAHVFCRTFAFQLFRVYAGERFSMTLVLFGTTYLVSVPTQNRVVLEFARE